MVRPSEDGTRLVVQILVVWGDGGGGNVIDARTLRMGQSFALNADLAAAKPFEEAGLPPLPGDASPSLGSSSSEWTAAASRIGRGEPLVTHDARGVLVHCPEGAVVEIGGVVTLATPWELHAGDHARVKLGDLWVDVVVDAAKKLAPVPLGARLREAGLSGTVVSAAMHAGALALLAFLVPALSPNDAEAREAGDVSTMRRLLDASAERELERAVAAAMAAGGDAKAEGTASDDGRGGLASGLAGQAGRPDSAAALKAYAVKGLSRRTDARLPSEQGRALMDETILGVIASNGFGPDTLRAPWTSVLNGADAQSAAGGLYAADVGDTYGSGLSLRGPGEGGGGLGEGVGTAGLDSLLGFSRGGGCTGPLCTGVFGNKSGVGPIGPGDGMGSSHGPPQGSHRPSPVRMRPAPVTVAGGRLPAEVILRVLHDNRGRFEGCYRNGLVKNPSLAGRVAVKFVIDRSGAVMVAQDEGSDLPDVLVRQCIVRSMYGVSFPAPENGSVNVTYPILFSPE